MKFDYIIGNPPYQDETVGDQKSFAPPVYHKFMDASYRVGDRVCLVTPARFLFRAGGTPARWNDRMLNDPHFKVLEYIPDSKRVFKNSGISGGVVITYRDKAQNYGSIGTFTPYPQLNGIFRKVVKNNAGGGSLLSIIYNQNKFDLSALYTDFPQFKNVIGSEGKDKRFRNNIFEKISIFSDEPANSDDLRILGLVNNKRVWKYFPAKYIDKHHKNLYKYKVIVPRANGEILSSPFVSDPMTGYTQSFLGIGAFDKKSEAEMCLKYLKCKFARCMLQILKITQDTPPEKWKYVPLQDFTDKSDLDWTKSVKEIDRQLYAKYGLSPDEIRFIEEKVKEME